MLPLAISLLWLLIYAICLCGVIWLVLYGIKKFVYPEFPERLEQGIWFIVLVLIVIAALTLLAGGSIGGVRPFR